MYRPVHGSTAGLPDVERFIAALNGVAPGLPSAARHLFEPGAELYVTRAPGRLDVMGGIADYSGSLVLELPIREATHVALQRQASRTLRIVTLTNDHGRDPVFEMPLAELERDGVPVSYETARDRFRHNPARHWAAYAAGAFLVLMREHGARFAEGASILIASDVPEGKGVSSSAAIEVAVMEAVAAAFDIAIEARDLAILSQKVENLVVGAPCGVMDQMTAVLGEKDRLLALLCQPAEVRASVGIPEGVSFWGIDSGVRHSVAGADYGSVRIGAFMGYRMIADLAGLTIQHGRPHEPVHVVDPLWHGYLANVTPPVFEAQYAALLPERITGRDFLARFGNTTDPVTRVDPDREYAVRLPTAHPIYEHARVQRFAELLTGPIGEPQLAALGELMYQSHASYSACGLGSAGTDRLVKMVRDAGPASGLYGAKITGGGSGGTVAVLGRGDAGPAITAIADDYARRQVYRPYVFLGSSPGAASFGHLRLVAGDRS